MSNYSSLDLSFLCQVWREVVGDAPSTYEGRLLSNYLDRAHELLDEFKEIAFPSGFGFDPFTAQDLMAFLSCTEEWNLTFNKKKGEGILYGRRHVKIRQQLVNDLPDTMRRALLFKKIQFVMSFLSIHLKDISEIQDIGMGSSVYRLQYKDTNGEDQDCVIKQEELVSQSFIIQVLKYLGWTSYASSHWISQKGAWEISEYISKESLQDRLNDQDISHDLLEQLGNHAALGDCLGRGDRHPENYMVREGKLYPIDISYLFWDDNESWVEKYIQGGMAEYSVCILANLDEVAIWQSVFWQAYHSTYRQLQDSRTDLLDLMTAYYGEKNPDLIRKKQFLNDRLLSSNYERLQKERYNDAFKKLVHQSSYKHKLDRLLRLQPEKLRVDPWMKMYALANENRLASFYQVETFQPTLFERLE